MTGYAADLPAIGATAAALRSSADALDVDLTVSGVVGPGRLGPAVAALLTGVRSDLDQARGTVAALSEEVDRVRTAYAALDTDVATGFDQGPW